VADTDDPIDQEVKLLVRDEILSLLETVKSNASTKQEAMGLLRKQLPELQKAANDLLRNMGMCYNAEVTLQEEPFPARNYDTFSLPSGIYDSIRVTIGDGEGKNWWCVVFPDLCGAAAAVDVEDTAVEAGISDSLSKTLTQADGYQIRFWLLDCIGKLQIFF
jgi:stage II sporulation protein R